MRVLDLTLPTPAENLAWEEAYLESCDAGNGGELLRFYESSQQFVVVGYGNKVDAEVDLAGCKKAGVGVYRRLSGGGTVVQGPGCLSYAVFLEIRPDSPLASITSTNQFIMEKNCAAISKLLNRKLQIQGHTDLALDGKKFSGNAQRRRKKFVLFHGTFLLDFEIAPMSRLLKMPSIQPSYREGRTHSDFLKNLNMKAAQVKDALKQAWGALDELQNPTPELPSALIAKYNSDEWNLRT